MQFYGRLAIHDSILHYIKHNDFNALCFSRFHTGRLSCFQRRLKTASKRIFSHAAHSDSCMVKFLFEQRQIICSTHCVCAKKQNATSDFILIYVQHKNSKLFIFQKGNMALFIPHSKENYQQKICLFEGKIITSRHILNSNFSMSAVLGCLEDGLD